MTVKDGSANAAHPSALEAWASTRMAGASTDDEDGSDVGRAPGHAHYDPADVISVFMSARESGKQRNDQARDPQPE